MKLLILTLAAATLAAPLPSQLGTAYTAGRTVRITTTTQYLMETVDFQMLVDGEPMEGRDMGQQMTEETRMTEQVDEWIAAEDGSLTKLKRSFETIEGNALMTRGENEMEQEREAPLAGLTLLLERGEEGLTVEVSDGDEPDDAALLEGHTPELVLDVLLPDTDLAEGATWEFDGDAIMHVLGLDMEEKFFPRPEPTEGEGEGRRGGRGRGMRGGGRSPFAPFKDLEWTGKATVESLETEHEGQMCAKIVLEITGEGELPERERGGRGGRGGRALELATAPLATSYSVKLEGELWFSLDAKMPIGLELSGSLTQDSERESTRNESNSTMISLQEGDLTHKITVAVEAE